MLGIPRMYLNVRRPGSLIHWYRSVYVSRRRARHELTRVLPVVAQVEPTVRCDLDCTFCQSKEIRRTRTSPDMTLEEFQHVVNQLHFLLGLSIVGMGEPTLHPDFARMVGYAIKKGICTQTVTNCNRHSPEIAEQLVSMGLNAVRVSVDGATPGSYEKTRKGARFERTLENISRLVSYRGNRKDPRIIVQMVALECNYTEMPDFVRLASRIGVDEVNIQARITAWGKKCYIEKTLQKDGAALGEDFEQYLRVARQIASEKGIDFEVGRNLYSDKNKCPKPWRDVYISTTGEVVPCCAIADPLVRCMGNILQEPFISIWNNKKYRTFRGAIISGKVPGCCFQCYSPDVYREKSRNENAQQSSQA